LRNGSAKRGCGRTRRARLFRDRGSDAAEAARGVAGAAQLAHAQIVVEPVSPARPGPAERYRVWRRRTSDRLAALDLAPDLGSDIGSRRWLRGAGTLLGLSAIALAGWPDFAPVLAAPAITIDDPVRDEFRSQMIMPLALGADSGRRMGATAAVIALRNAPER